MARIKTEKNGSRKDVIVSKAATLFREKGYKAASMRDLAEAVGVEAASLYNHIKSKSELLHELVFNVANRFVLKMDEIESEPISSLQKMEKLLRFHISEMNYQNQRRVYRKRIAAIIEEGIRNKEIKAIDAPTVVLIFLHAVSGIESWHRSTKKINATELEQNMVAILIDGLKSNK